MDPVRHLIIIAAVLSSACTETLTQALERLPRTQPDPPISVEDTVTATALRDALATGYVHGPRVIASGHGALRSSSLPHVDRKSTRLNSSHVETSYAVFCLKKKKQM